MSMSAYGKIDIGIKFSTDHTLMTFVIKVQEDSKLVVVSVTCKQDAFKLMQSLEEFVVGYNRDILTRQIRDVVINSHLPEYRPSEVELERIFSKTTFVM